MHEAQGNINIKENIQENIQEFKEKRKYRRYARVMAGGMCSLIGTLLAIYIGGWLMILSPVRDSIAAYCLGTLTKKMVFSTIIKCALSLTTAGAVWCAGYIMKCKIIGYEEC